MKKLCEILYRFFTNHTNFTQPLVARSHLFAPLPTPRFASLRSERKWPNEDRKCLLALFRSGELWQSTGLLDCTLLYCSWIVLSCTVVYSNALPYATLYCTLLFCTEVWRIVLYYILYIVMVCVVLYWNALHTVFCRDLCWYFILLFSTALYCMELVCSAFTALHCTVLKCSLTRGSNQAALFGSVADYCHNVTVCHTAPPTVHYAVSLYAVHCTLYTVQMTVIQCTLAMSTVHFTVFSWQCTVTVYSTLCHCAPPFTTLSCICPETFCPLLLFSVGQW